MKKLLTLIALSLSWCTYAQDNYIGDDGIIETRPVTGFSSITVSDGINVYLTSSDEESIKVTASEEKYLDKFVTEVEGNTLKIYYVNSGINFATNSKRQLKAFVSYKTLQAISATGGATVALENTLETTGLTLSFTGKSSFKGSIEAEDIHVNQSVASAVSISGKADNLHIESATGSLFKGYDFIADYCNAKATGGAVIRITINKELIAKAKSGGGIRYKGDASVKGLDINTGGAVKKDDE